MRWKALLGSSVACLLMISGFFVVITYAQAQNPQQGSVGVQGTISSPPPTQGATISLPRDGQSFNQLPVTVSGLCPDGLLIKLFKNNVFAGSQQCANGSFSMQVDLFIGANELVARVFDALDQAGPDSNKVTVSFNDNRPGSAPRITLTSDFAKRGANPGQKLTWPIIMSGGSGPYAVSIDWGDGKAPDLKSVTFPGTFDIDHAYESSGIYNIIIKATDKNGDSAFLQLVGVANGALSQDNQGSATEVDSPGTTTRIIWQPAALAIPLLVATFWLGKRHELKTLKRKIEEGQRPF